MHRFSVSPSSFFSFIGSMRRVLTVLALGAQSMAAQSRPAIRTGFTAAFGVSVVQARLSCDTCTVSGSASGSGGRFTLGYAVRPDMLVALEVAGGGGEAAGGWRGMGWISAVTQWYPRSEKPWFVKGGLGMSNGSMAGPNGSRGPFRHSRGFGTVVGGGYDWRVRRMLSVTPYVTWGWASHATLSHSASEREIRFGGSVLQGGLALTIH